MAIGLQVFANVTGVIHPIKSRGRLELCRESVVEEMLGENLEGMFVMYYREDLFNCRQEDTLRRLQEMGANGVIEIAHLVRGFATYW